MPQQRVVVKYEKSPQHVTKLPPMEMSLAQKVKRALDPTKDGVIKSVDLEDVPDSESV